MHAVCTLGRCRSPSHHAAAGHTLKRFINATASRLSEKAVKAEAGGENRDAIGRSETPSHASSTGSDYLVRIAAHPTGRKVLKALGLPRPAHLIRDYNPVTRPLKNAQIVVLSGSNTPSRMCAVDAIVGAGGTTCGPATTTVKVSMAGRIPPRTILSSGAVIDLTDVTTIDGISALFRRTKEALNRLDSNARIVFLTRDPTEASLHTGESAAVAAACAGFVRSLSKELGMSGTTANLLCVADGAVRDIPEPLVHLLSNKSAFITGQVISLTGDLGAALTTSAPSAAGHTGVSSQSMTIDSTISTADAQAAHLPDRLYLWRERLTGRQIVVTGAARGIGASTATRLAEEGAKLLLVDHPSQEEALADMTRRLFGRASYACADLGAEDASASVAASVAGWCVGGLDGFVHNAGITRDRMFSRMEESAFQRVIDVNLGAIIKIDRALFAGGHVRDNARMVLVSSISGIAGAAGQTNYSASKSGVIGYCRQMAKEWASRGLAYNAVAPGFIETPMTAAMPAVAREVARRSNSMSQGGVPLDIAETIVLLSSPRTRLTGQVVRVCGGHPIGQ
eukprot:Opistho-2@12295